MNSQSRGNLQLADGIDNRAREHAADPSTSQLPHVPG